MARTELQKIRHAGKDYTAIDMLELRSERLNEILPQASGLTAGQLIQIAQFECQRNTKLAECEPNSIVSAVYDAARLGLLLGREAHLVPFNRKCTMVPDYRGYVAAAMRSGAVSMIDADVVFKEDQFEVAKGSDPKLVHVPDYGIDRGNTEEILFVYAVAWLSAAPRPLFHVMNRMEVERIRKSSRMSDGIPWTQWWDRQAMKTVTKFLIDKRLPLTKVREITDMLEVDTRVDTGQVTRPLRDETEGELATAITEETQARQEELKMALDDKKAEQAAKKK